MSTSAQPLPIPYQFYHEQSAAADRARYDDFAHGREEMLDDLLELIGRGDPFDDEAKSRLTGMPQNRRKKHARLRQVLRSTATLETTDQTLERLVLREHIALVRAKLTVSEWQIEWRLAAGEPFAVIAVGERISVGTLKMRVSRWRERVRMAFAA